MAVEIPPGYLLAAWEFVFPGDPEPWYCTMGFENAGDTTNYTAIADYLFLAWANSVLTNQSTLLSLSGVTVKVGNDGPPIMGYSSLAAQPGGKAQNMLPQNCALLVDKLSAEGGRRGRGRLYVPGFLEEGRVDNVGRLDENLFSDAVASFVALEANFVPANGIDLDPVLLHSPSPIGTLNGTPAGPPTPITSFRVQQTISTQRKRLR